MIFPGNLRLCRVTDIGWLVRYLEWFHRQSYRTPRSKTRRVNKYRISAPISSSECVDYGSFPQKRCVSYLLKNFTLWRPSAPRFLVAFSFPSDASSSRKLWIGSGTAFVPSSVPPSLSGLALSISFSFVVPQHKTPFPLSYRCSLVHSFVL